MKMTSISSLTLFASIFLASSFYLTEADLITDVCKAATHPATCEKILRSDPRSGRANLVGLGQISIDQSASATKAAITAAKSVATGANKKRIDFCVSSFTDAIDFLDQCRGVLKSGDINSFRTYASAALTDVTDCDDDFEGKEEPAKLKRALDFASENLSVLLAVGFALDNGK